MATKSEIKKIASALDSVAEAIEKRYSELGIPEKVASDFAYRCDLLADTLDKTATAEPEADADAQTTEASVEVPVPEKAAELMGVTKGPLEHGPSDSETLDGEFTQEEFSSLFSLLKGLSDGSDTFEDDDSHEEDEDEDEDEDEKGGKSEGDSDDADLAEQLQKVAAQLRAKAKKK
jgi:hypothetical protein